MIINSKAGCLGSDNITNLFRLKTAMPDGDWTATVKFSSEFPAANEMYYLALLQDKDHWTAATLAANPHWIWQASLPVGGQVSILSGRAGWRCQSRTCG
ncbi:MAG: hypothetical protein ACREDD_07010 [Methylocella sp.]